MVDSIVYTIHATAAETVSGQSDALDITQHDEAIAFLDVSAASGTSPDMVVSFEYSPDGVMWFDSGIAYTAVTAVSRPAIKQLTNFGRWVRAKWVITGTTPSFTFSMALIAKN
jgi:hypothetical protein